MGPSTGLSVLKLCEFKSCMEGSYASVCVSVSACVHFKTAWKSFGSSVPRPLGADGGHVLGLQSRGNQLQVPPPPSLLLQGNSLLISFVITPLIAKTKLMAGSSLISPFSKSPIPPFHLHCFIFSPRRWSKYAGRATMQVSPLVLG